MSLSSAPKAAELLVCPGEVPVSMNLTLMFERDVPGVLGRCVECYDLIRGKTLEKLSRIAVGLDVRPLENFRRDPPMDHLPEEARIAMTLGYWSEEAWGPRPEDPEPLWYDPAEGLVTLRALLGYLREHPKAVRGGSELEEMERALAEAAEARVRFHVYFDV